MTRAAARRILEATVLVTLMVGVGLVPLSPTWAQAPLVSTEECIASHLAAQKLKKDGQLSSAKAALLSCVQDGCPAPIRAECVEWIGEIDEAMPSILVTGVDAMGQDTANVRVLIDGKPVAESLDGRPLLVDPGPHKVTCEHGVAAQVQDVVIVQGQKNRPIRCSFAATPDPEPEVPTPAEEGAPLAQLIAGSVIGVLGLGALATFAALGTIGKNEADELDVTCGRAAPPPNTQTCTDEQIDPVRTKLIAADVSLGVGIGLVGVSLGLIIHYLVTAPDDGETAIRLELGPSLGGGAGQLTVPF